MTVSVQKIIGAGLKSVSESLSRHRLFRLSGLTASLLASMRQWQWVSVNWDGADWVYKWGKSGAVHSMPTYNPKNNTTNIDLFFHAYTPASGEVIVDVGVENGEEIPSFCAQVGRAGKVYAIEADPSCCRRLRKLKEMLGLDNLIVIEAAVGASAGQMLFTQDLGSLANRVVKPGEYAGRSISVEVKPLEDLLIPHGVQEIDYLKVNIEGAEIELLKSLSARIPIRNLCISCHDFVGPEIRSYDFVHAWLTGKHYTVKSFEPQGLHRPWRNYYLYASRAGGDPNPHLG